MQGIRFEDTEPGLARPPLSKICGQRRVQFDRHDTIRMGQQALCKRAAAGADFDGERRAIATSGFCDPLEGPAFCEKCWPSLWRAKIVGSGDQP